MKTAKVNDFDPDAKVPTLKSSLEGMPSIQKPTFQKENKSDVSASSPLDSYEHIKKNGKTVNITEQSKITVRDVRPVPPVLPVRPVPPKRVMKQRWPVDIYQDQYESLQRLALEERLRGRIGSMSAMIREALDRLISEKKASKG